MAIFYVFQGKTYEKEQAGGYVWSPQLTKNGKKNAGYTNMTQIVKGDFILHNKNGDVVAISIADEDYREADQPQELSVGGTSGTWNLEGYQVNLKYYPFDTGLKTSTIQEWLTNNFKQDSAFTRLGKGKQQYMCNLSDEHARYILEKAIEIQHSEEVLNSLKSCLDELINDKDSEYDQIEMDIINSTIDIAEDIVADDYKTTEPGPQKTINSSATGRTIAKRNPKIAVLALKIADHKCEYNCYDRTFLRKNGERYTEPHHLIPISKYRDFELSLDVKENIVSLCSHCHNLLHYGKYEEKEIVLNQLYNTRIDKLNEYGIDLTLEQLEAYYE